MSLAVDRDQAFLAAISRVAEDVAAVHADGVDREGRFPSESFDALREERALSAYVADEHGGGGVSIAALATACAILGRRCASTSMIYAMHQIQVACIQRHADLGGWFGGYLRELSTDQRLIASATSEIGTGGDIGRSIAAVEPTGDGTATFTKQAPVISYGADADDLLTSLRRSPEAQESDQVMALTSRGQAVMEPIGSWDALGMRGTCSTGATVSATFPDAQLLTTPFSTVVSETMVPITHILWAHVWLGIAEDAFDRARAFSRAAARRAGNQPSAGGAQVSHVLRDLTMLRSQVAAAVADFTVADATPQALHTVSSMLRFNTLKVAASDMAVQVCRGALAVTGIQGYKNDTPYSVGRHLRDTLSAGVMVANERIHATNAEMLLIAKDV